MGGGEVVAVARDVTRRKVREQDLLLLSTAMNQVHDMLIITDAQLDRSGPQILYVNDTFVRQSGYSRAEAIGQTPRILQGEDTDPGTLRQLKEKLQDGQPFQCELYNYTREGKGYWTELSVVPIKGEGGNPTHFVSVQRDITERKEVQRKLEESAEAFESLFNPLPMWVLDGFPGSE